MRTTVEITDNQRSRLLKLAAERGEKGFSRLVQEAIEHYLKEQVGRRERTALALSVLGTLDEDSARRMEDQVKALRGSWR